MNAPSPLPPQKTVTDALGAIVLVLVAIGVVVLCLSEDNRQRVVAAATTVGTFATLFALATVYLALRQLDLQRVAIEEQRVQNSLELYSRLREKYARFLGHAHDVLLTIVSNNASDNEPDNEPEIESRVARKSLYKMSLEIELDDRDQIRLAIVSRVFEILAERAHTQFTGSLLAEHARWLLNVATTLDPVKDTQPPPMEATTHRLVRTKGQDAINTFSATLTFAQSNLIRRDVIRMAQRALRASIAASEDRLRTGKTWDASSATVESRPE